MKKVKIATVLEIEFDLICLLCPVHVESKILRKRAIFSEHRIFFPAFFAIREKLFITWYKTYRSKNLSVVIQRQKN
jgi:hypothetical protein